MAERYGEYGAFLRKGGKSIAWQKEIDGRMQLVKTVAVPEEVRAYLTSKLLDEPEVNDGAEDGLRMLADEPARPTVELNQATDIKEFYSEQVPTAENTSAIGTPIRTELDMARQALEEMTGKTIYDAPIKDIAEALYERFGIYTAYLNRLPQDDEINPFTARPMTRYEKGVAYQSFIRVMNSGILNSDLEAPKKALDASREASVNLQDQFVQAPQTFAEQRAADSFEYRTSVEGDKELNSPKTHLAHYTDKDGVVHTVRVDVDPGTSEGNGATSVAMDKTFGDEPVVQPQFGKQVIRPNW